MATGTSVAICLRCEWRGAERDGRTACPRCGEPLYRQQPSGRPSGRPSALARPRAPSPAREGPRRSDEAYRLPAASAAIVDPPGGPDAEASPRRARSWWVWLGALCAALAAGVFLAPRGTDGDRVAADAGAEGPAANRDRVEVPAPLRIAVTDEAEITVASLGELADLGGPLFRLWRLTLPEGRLLSGPIVAPVQVLRTDPRPDADRVAFIERGGDLFLLDGFVGARPRRVAGDVRDFDILPDGSIVYASVTYRTARCCGGSETVVEVGRTRPDAPLRADRFRRGIRSLSVKTVAVRGTRAYVWGIQDGGHHLVELDLERRRRVDRSLRGLRAIDVGPGDRLLVGLRAGIGHVSVVRPHPHGAIPRIPGFLLRQVLAWSQDGATVAAYGVWEGREGVWVIRLGQRRPLYGTSASGPPTTAAFLPGGRLLAWTEPGHVAIADVTARSVHRIRLPDGFPELLSAVAAG